MIENVEYQRLGVVCLGYEVSKLPIERFDDDPTSFDMNTADGGFDRDFARGCLKLPYGLPIRFSGFHVCADAPQWQGITDMVMVTVCKVVRLRFRVPYGKLTILVSRAVFLLLAKLDAVVICSGFFVMQGHIKNVNTH